MKSKKILKIISIILLSVIIFSFITSNIYAKKFSIEKADLYSKGYCKSLLKNTPTGGTIKVAKVFYKSDGIEYPAYCLNVELDGVGKVDGYTVTVDKVVDNELVRNVMINGYPYKSFESMGVEDVDEAFTATKMAVYCVLYDYDKDNYKKFEAIGEAGERTLKAMKKIVETARNSKGKYEEPNIGIEEIDKKWSVDEKDKEYISRKFKAVSTVDINEFDLNLDETKIEGIKITDLENNEKRNFKNNTEFKILVPIKELKEKGCFKININGSIETKPILYGKAPNSSVQNYALAGLRYETTIENKEVDYPENDTTIVVEKISYETNESLKGAIFNVYNENKELLYKDLEVDENGLVTIENVIPGKYYIEEIKSPDGYEKKDELVEVDINYGEKKMISITNNKIKITTKIDTDNKLPKTGF